MQKYLLLKEWQLALLLGGGMYVIEILDVLAPLVSNIIYSASMTLVVLWYYAVVFMFSPKESRKYKFWNYLYLSLVIICIIFIWVGGLIIPSDWFYDVQSGDLDIQTGIIYNLIGIIVWLFLIVFVCHILLTKEEKYFGKYKSDAWVTFLQLFFLFVGVFFLSKRIKHLI